MNYFSLFFTSLSFLATPQKQFSTLFVPDPPPPLTWTEHWFDHTQVLKRQYFDNSIALYYDDDMDKSITWPIRYLGAAWAYTQKNYGPFGDSSRLFINLHAAKYGGGHPSTYFDASHDYRNVIDIGQKNSWADSTGWNLDATVHEIGHIIEGSSHHTHNSPAFGIWHDSKWIEIFQYDVYKKLGWESDADRWYTDKMKTIDNFPHPNTQWFKNWFYPIYSENGETAVLKKFFTLLAENFPKNSIGKDRFEYTRNLNFGEFVFFWSGAAGKDLKELALHAFGSKDEKGTDWIPQFDQAKKEFSKIKF
ncbi:hypothetical protein SAMN05216436_10692 [bacterium A37T11]|nr:hypothetical protein SAMN05216436_10692 [bacterium A37T11]